MTQNFGAAAADYAKHRAGFPESFFDRLAGFDIGRPGQTVVDLGTGTGTVARGLAQRGCTVIGIDPDERMLAQARELDKAAGVAIEYRTGTAESIPVDDHSTDVITAGTAWHWFDAVQAAREVQRIARPGAAVVIAIFAWLPLPGNVVEATEHLIEKHNPQWKLGGGIGIDVQAVKDLQAGGFTQIETFSYDLDVPYTHESWRGRIRASAGVGASLTQEGVTAFDNELKAILEQDFNTEILPVHHRVFAATGRVK